MCSVTRYIVCRPGTKMSIISRVGSHNGGMTATLWNKVQRIEQSSFPAVQIVIIDLLINVLFRMLNHVN